MERVDVGKSECGRLGVVISTIWGIFTGSSGGDKKKSTNQSNSSTPTPQLTKKPSIANKMMMASMRSIDAKTDLSDLDRKIDIEQVL